MATIGVIGGGTMGSGIAQICAMRGFSTILYDVSDEMLVTATATIHRNLTKAVELGKTRPLTLENARINLSTTTDMGALAEANLVIEAAPETMDIKRDIFSRLDQIVQPEAILATNTSSLSITAIAAATNRPHKVIGLHFFNPAHLMALVEIVRGDQTDDATLNTAVEFVRAVNKTPVICNDTPAFIVNRIARPFYGEALRLLAENVDLTQGVTQADVVFKIDTLMKSLGFRMGPFELMDLIGLDVNFAVTQSVYNAFFQEPKYRPHPIQQKMVESGQLGRKTKKGFYEYSK
jgi:3-hydroxybutyryl-CoA dehydrogenase